MHQGPVNLPRDPLGVRAPRGSSLPFLTRPRTQDLSTGVVNGMSSVIQKTRDIGSLGAATWLPDGAGLEWTKDDERVKGCSSVWRLPVMLLSVRTPAQAALLGRQPDRRLPFARGPVRRSGRSEVVWTSDVSMIQRSRSCCQRYHVNSVYLCIKKSLSNGLWLGQSGTCHVALCLVGVVLV